MTDLRKAAEMALEALRYASAVAQRQLTTKTKQDYSLDLMNKSMAALEAELAQPEQEPVDIHCPSCLHSFSIVPVAKCEWVGLTDEEIDSIESGISRVTFVRAIEARLKELNA